MFRYRPWGVHKINWLYYTDILAHLTNYDCSYDYEGSPQPHTIYYEIVYYHNGVSIRSRIYEHQWLTTDDGLQYPSEQFRNVESRFIHRFIMNTFDEQFRDINYPSPAIK